MKIEEWYHVPLTSNISAKRCLENVRTCRFQIMGVIEQNKIQQTFDHYCTSWGNVSIDNNVIFGLILPQTKLLAVRH